MNARRTETCVAPRHVDASLDFYFIFSERAAWGRSALPDIFFFLFSRPRAGLATVESRFFRLATNALNVRKNNNSITVGFSPILYC